jgi:hypothetical protein
MSSPRLSIRVDVDVEHAREILDAQLARVGAAAGVTPSKAAVANAVRALRERLRAVVAAAYPEARVVVTMWRKEPKARATKVRVGHRTADGHVERRCALISEHVDALRAATIEAMRHEVAATPLAPLGDGGLLDDVPALPALFSESDADQASAGLADATRPPA